MLIYFKDTCLEVGSEMKNKYFVFLLSIMFILLICHFYINSKEETNLFLEQKKIVEAIDLIKTGDTVEGLLILDNFIDSKYSDTYIFNLNYARALAKEGKFNESLIFYIKAYNINPLTLRDDVFVAELEQIEGKTNE